MKTVVFDFHKYAQTKLCAEDQLYAWARQFKTANISRVKINELPQLEYEQLIEHLEAGIICQFNPVSFEIYFPLHQKLTNARKKVDLYAVEKKRCAEMIAKCDMTLIQGEDIPAQLTGIVQKIAELRQQCANKKRLALLTRDSNYQALMKEKGRLKETLCHLSPENLAKKRDMAAERLSHLEAKEPLLVSSMQALEVKCKERLNIAMHHNKASAVALMPHRPSPLRPGTYDLPNQTIQVEWQDLYFGDGSCLVKYRGQALNSFPLPESRRSLNAVKAHYKFRNAPLLQLLINGRNILKVLNREVMFFYIQLLTDTGSYFDSEPTIRPLNISRFSAFNRQYYQKHLPNLFQNKSLEYLCQLADPQACIIPTPELVINSKGSASIDDSFLFPIKCHQKYYIAWESVEESKATYLFRTADNGLLKSLQLIYDYLVGPTVNKRTHLISSAGIQHQTGFVTRINHTFFTEWKAEIHARCQM